MIKMSDEKNELDFVVYIAHGMFYGFLLLGIGMFFAMYYDIPELRNFIYLFLIVCCVIMPVVGMYKVYN
jgi:hypothetical protein